MGSEHREARPIGIGELGRRTGTNIETVRYYERVGLLPEPPRTAGGHRQYDTQHLQRLRFVRRGRELGFSLDEVRSLLRLVDGGDYSCAEVRTITATHLEQVRRKLADLARLESVLADMVASCDQGQLPHCPAIEALNRV